MAAYAGIGWSPGGPVTIPPKIVNILTTAERVTAYRIVNQLDGPEYEKHKGKPAIGGYRIVETVPVARERAGEIARALTNPAYYLREHESWTCLFQPHHVVRFESKAGTVDAIICFECGDVQFAGAAGFGHGLRDMRPLYKAVTKVLPEPRTGGRPGR